MKRKSKFEKFARKISPTIMLIFTVTLFAVFWNFIITNKWIVLSVSGGLILLFMILGYLNKGKLVKGIKRRLK